MIKKMMSYFFIIIIVVLLWSSVFRIQIKPDLGLFLVFFIAVIDGARVGSLFAVILTLIKCSLGSGLFLLYGILYVVCAIVGGLLRKRIYDSSALIIMFLGMVISILFNAVVLFYEGIFHHIEFTSQSFHTVLKILLFDAVLILPVYYLLIYVKQKFDPQKLLVD